ncbi:MAG: hypothetical protein ABJJ05_11425 [Maribacter litoralis]|uniref:hypothetical protein n=1 Tax=Maribacter litoralis TaxID=2059726 RepID=UPI003299354B
MTGIFVFPQYGNVNGRRTNANFEAQLVGNNLMRSRDLLQDVLKQNRNIPIALSDIKGHPYTQEMFVNGNLFYKDSLKLGQFLMRYNAFADEMEVSNHSSINVIGKIDDLSIDLVNEKYVVLNYVDDHSVIKKGFFIEKSAGTKCSLFLKKFKSIKLGKEAKTSFHKSTKPVFIEHKAYYLKFGQNLPVEVKLKKNKIVKIFPEKANIIKKYIIGNDLDLDSESDLILLINFYNTLE